MSNFDVPSLMAALREHPVPLSHMIQLRDVIFEQTGRSNFLFAACRDGEADGSTLADQELAEALSGVALGQWPMGVSAIDSWVEAVLERKPAAVLEFGSGVSTVVSAVLMRRIHGTGAVRVFSVEQGEEAAAQTRARLEALGLNDLVAIHIAPVERTLVDAFESSGYAVTAEQMGSFLGDVRPEMVLIDGPFGGYGARFSTLPVAHPWLAEDAEIWMDDALRDSELAIAHWWTVLGYLSEPSLQFTAKGIVRGQRGDSPRHYARAAAGLGRGELQGGEAEYVLFKMRVQAAADASTGLKPPFQAG
jgi:protein-L-isoaspartate O-methyltransferase